MIAQQILANMQSSSNYNQWVKQLGDATDYESPFSAPDANGMSAQLSSNAYMALKQRRPMTMEYYKKNVSTGEVELKSMNMYINPEKLQISNQKVIGNVKTRGGIFYHHWGADNSTMVLTGTTGLSGMAGIKQLEEIYYASGTLLRYNNYTPTQIYNTIEDFKVLDYSDPAAVINSVSNSNFSADTISMIQQKVLNNATDLSVNAAYICTQLLEACKGNMYLSSMINDKLPNIYSDLTQWDLQTPYIHYRQFYQKMIDVLNKNLPGLDQSIIVNMAYELSLSKIYEDQQQIDKQDKINNVKKDTITNVANYQQVRDVALKDYISQLNDFNQRDVKIHNFLRSGFINIKDEMTDEWLPRLITIYFENRAYIGFFQSFSYNRDSKTNLISYELRFTITKQYEFNNSDDPYIPTTTTSQITPTNNQNNSVPTQQNKNLYTVTANDTLMSIANKFYGSSNLWPEIYAENINLIDDPNWIYPGQQFVIPQKPSGYWRWVVTSSDTLMSIAKRFYGDSSKWTRIYDANRNQISNPNMIYPKQIFKIPM